MLSPSQLLSELGANLNPSSSLILVSPKFGSTELRPSVPLLRIRAQKVLLIFPYRPALP